MGFVAGVLVAFMVFVSLPALKGILVLHDLRIANWRLARTCAITMGVLLAIGFVLLFNMEIQETERSMYTLLFVAGAVLFSIPTGAYLNTWNDHKYPSE